MAGALTLDIKTIEQYVSDIYSHVNIHDRTKLVLRIKEWQDWKSTQSVYSNLALHRYSEISPIAKRWAKVRCNGISETSLRSGHVSGPDPLAGNRSFRGMSKLMRTGALSLALLLGGLIGSSVAYASYFWDVYPPVGNSTGGTYLNASSNCFTQPYSWQHGFAYSIETFSSPKQS